MDDKRLEQDLSKAQMAGSVFVMHLLFKEPCEMPDKKLMDEVMTKHLSSVERFGGDDKLTCYLAKRYTAKFKDAEMPPQLMIMPCDKFDGQAVSALDRSQMWDCPESDRILSECGYQVCAIDMLAAPLDPKDRAEMLMDFMEALVEIFQQCEAVYFDYSGKMFTADKIRAHKLNREQRFIYFAVNVRYFNVEGTQDMLVDTRGMGTLFLPDLQYHFRGVDPNIIVNHAYNVASFVFANDNPIKNNDTIDGADENGLNEELQWRCRYERSLVQPAREVIDINIGDNAAGTRE